MRCLYCGTPLAIMRMMANGSFCCDEHAELFEKQQSAPTLESARPLALPQAKRCGEATVFEHTPIKRTSLLCLLPENSAAPEIAVTAPARPISPRKPSPRSSPIRVRVPASAPLAPRLVRALPQLGLTGGAHSWPPRPGKVPLVVAERPGSSKVMIKAAVTPADAALPPWLPRLDAKPSPLKKAPAGPPPLSIRDIKRRPPQRGIDLSSQKLREIWQNAPGDLKLVAMVIPMILLLTLNAAGPKLYTKPVAIKAASQPMIDGMLTRQWHTIRRNIVQRAAFHYEDDFRSGLDAWLPASGPQTNWTYDNMGFVRPGGLALLRPTLKLNDYQVEFVGRFEQKALGFVFRAADTSNYQAVKLILVRTGSLPSAHLVRYTVLNGKETGRSDKILPTPLSTDTFFTVDLEVRGGDFTLMVQGKLADFWTDDRLKTGGIGFFCGKGESACLRRVEVSYQNDALGRVCGFIASGDMDSSNDGS